MRSHPMAELYIVSAGHEPITRHVYHVPRVGDRMELRERRTNDPDDVPEQLSGDVVGVTWCDGNNGAVRIELLRDEVHPGDAREYARASTPETPE